MIIDEEQSVFLKGRYIGNNIRLILDLIDYRHSISDDSLILFIDFYKVFDTIELYFMFKVIAFFGFGMFFQKAIQTLYNGSNSSVKLTHVTCPRFNMGRGIRQGCPISPLHFVLVVQVMATHIKKASSLPKGTSTLRPLEGAMGTPLAWPVSEARIKTHNALDIGWWKPMM